MTEENHQFTNALIHESSPYLQQHAHNPVNWLPWSKEVFDRAKDENKLVIVSIGYSACHWCHVMEKECFEDEQVAKLMNSFYLCIKVDREERPDVDQFYMDACTLMTGRGGWPLNAFALPDGRAVYAGTYFPKPQWTGLLRELAVGYKREPAKYEAYAEKLLQGVKGLSLVQPAPEETSFSPDKVKQSYISIAQLFDRQNGGKGRAPKFPMPGIYLFLMRYDHIGGAKEALDHTILTLDKMAHGGIYDQIGGGFARYSTDASWKVPHFEKMLYDNAQLISLYSEAWQLTKKPLYKKVVYDTIGWLKREMKSAEGAFYCALDADSEGVEGKFYVWSSEELKDILDNDAKLVSDYYGTDNAGLWEEGRNILLVAADIEMLSGKYHLTVAETEEKIEKAKQKLRKARESRVRPGLDNKILLSWNALTIEGLLTAYKIFHEEEFLHLAENALSFIYKNLQEGTLLFRSISAGNGKIPAFLEDYAYYIHALIAYYQISFDRTSLEQAVALSEQVISNFSDPSTGLFYFTASTQNELAARKIDTQDNVMPSPNSVMAHNLFLLGTLLEKKNYLALADKMLSVVLSQVTEYAAFYSNWAALLLYRSFPFYEVAILGHHARNAALGFEAEYHPLKVVVGAENADEGLPLLANRYKEGQTLIYVCENKTCQRPVETAADALQLMKDKEDSGKD